MNTLFLFRFETRKPTLYDIEILDNATKYEGESYSIKPTEFGFVAIIIANFEPGGLQIRYKRAEKINEVFFPLFIFKLNSPKAKCTASFFNLNQLRSLAEKVPSDNQNNFIEYTELTIDQILEKIHASDIESILPSERIQLDNYSKKLRTEDKNSNLKNTK